MCNCVHHLASSNIEANLLLVDYRRRPKYHHCIDPSLQIFMGDTFCETVSISDPATIHFVHHSSLLIIISKWRL